LVLLATIDAPGKTKDG